jgi:hypothetical protein
MKKLTLTILFIGNLCWGQFFESTTDNEDFSMNEEISDPEQGMDEDDDGDDNGPGTPGEQAPINHWLFLLPLAALAIGSHRLLRNKQERI